MFCGKVSIKLAPCYNEKNENISKRKIIKITLNNVVLLLCSQNKIDAIFPVS